MLAFLKTVNIALIQKRQYSNDMVIAFLKRLALICLHSPEHFQCGVLLFMKRVINKYPNAKSVIDFSSIGTNEFVSKEDLRIITNDDPQLLTTTHQLTIYHELICLAETSTNQYITGMVRSILDEKQLPEQLLNITPLELCKKMYLSLK